MLQFQVFRNSDIRIAAKNCSLNFLKNVFLVILIEPIIILFSN